MAPQARKRETVAVDELAAIKAIVASCWKTFKLISRKDRLLRFGADLVFALCEAQGIEIVIVNRGEQPPFEQERRHPLLLGRGSVDVVRENSAELNRL